MRDLNKDIDKFKKLDAVVYPILSDSEKGAKKLESKCDECQISIHFDKKKDVVKKLNQEVIPWKLGRMPAVLIADIAGTIQYAHFGQSMSDIPENEELFQVLEKL